MNTDRTKVNMEVLRAALWDALRPLPNDQCDRVWSIVQEMIRIEDGPIDFPRPQGSKHRDSDDRR